VSDNLESLNLWRQNFIDEIVREASVEKTFNAEMFITKSIDLISQDGTIDEPVLVNHAKTQTKIHAYTYSNLDRSLSIVTSNFLHIGEDWTKPQARSEVLKITDRGKRFIEKSMNDSFYKLMEEGDTDYSAARRIRNLIDAEQILKIKLYYLTDGLLSERTKQYKTDNVLSIPTIIRPYDVSSLREIDESDSGEEEIVINFNDECNGLNALSTNLSGLKSYLVVMPGNVLRNIYDKWDQRLLESNVRNFLNFTNKKNQAIRRTLLDEPEKFFAYNNGLTVTATDIETEDKGDSLKITKLKNMQIVNGGQTTCVIFFSSKEKGFHDIDLSKVSIPMKLTIIEKAKDIEELERNDLFKSNIAEYANFQSAVNASDLMSNSPFHIRLQQASKRANAMNNLGINTFWFYERTKGQWNTEKRLHKNEKSFMGKYPKHQLITKELMAKYENSSRLKPFEVSKGQGKNLSSFYKTIELEFRNNEDKFRDQFYKDLVSKAILWKAIDLTISRANSSWFIRETYLKPFVTTYSMALIFSLLREANRDLNLDLIWQNQAISSSLQIQIEDTAKHVNECFLDDSFRNNTSYREWAGKEACWQRFITNNEHKLQYLEKSDYLFASEIIEKEESNNQMGKIAGELEIEVNMTNISSDEWKSFIAYQIKQGFDISEPSVRIPQLMMASHTNGKLPSDKQILLLAGIYKKAVGDGFYFDIK